MYKTTFVLMISSDQESEQAKDCPTGQKTIVLPFVPSMGIAFDLGYIDTPEAEAVYYDLNDGTFTVNLNLLLPSLADANQFAEKLMEDGWTFDPATLLRPAAAMSPKVD